MPTAVTRKQVLAFRVSAQQLDRTSGHIADTAVLDLGVQDTGPDGARWALAIRGVDAAQLDVEDLSLAWTIRGAPHTYRRVDMPSVAVAVQPYSETDASKRIFDASKPLKAAGIATIDALDQVAEAMRSIVTRPTGKGEMSAALAERLPPPFLRYCRPCQATHLFEQTFRLSALRAGLELQPATSPPVLQPIPKFSPADTPDARHDPIRAYLRLLGPATPKHVADYLDAPVKDVRQRWPDDAADVSLEGEQRWILKQDLDAVTRASDPTVTRLLGPFDLFLQARDRSLLVDDTDRTKALWPVLGRPGAVLHRGEIVGTWRPRSSGGRNRKLRLEITLWRPASATTSRAITEQAERLAAFRGAQLIGVDVST